jgi:hypothetical protein
MAEATARVAKQIRTDPAGVGEAGHETPAAIADIIDAKVSALQLLADSAAESARLVRTTPGRLTAVNLPTTGTPPVMRRVF